MITSRNIEGSQFPGAVDLVGTQGTVDYIKNGTIYKNNPVASVLVTGSSDLTNLTNYGTGTIAYTAGFTHVWQKDATDSWVSII